MDKKLISISETAQKLNVTMTTLRRWDKAGKLRSVRINPKGRRYYDSNEIDLLLNDIFTIAKNWVVSDNPENMNKDYLCIDSQVFNSKLGKLENLLQSTKGLENDFSLITSVVGEIGNNSFDHNIGSWPDIRGILFIYDLNKKQIVLADRGQGILKTLKRVRPELTDDKEALLMAFTEKVSGRAPESRGNGLKYVRKVITNISSNIPIKLFFKSGQATLSLKYGTINLDIVNSDISFRGCLALISF